MSKQIFVKWLKINVLCFVGAFIIALLLALLFPDIMRGFIGRWIKLSFTVVPLVLEPTTKKALFTGIFVRNSISVLVFFIKPERKQLFEHWKKDITTLWYWPKQERNWKMVFKENKKELILFSVVILALLLFGAWFEVWGY